MAKKCAIENCNNEVKLDDNGNPLTFCSIACLDRYFNENDFSDASIDALPESH